MASTKKYTTIDDPRLAWFREARFGMFLHWGVYSQLARGEWVQNHEYIPIPEYNRIADAWRVKPSFAGEWARVARDAGAKYVVLTTKHHDGFCLWDTKMTDFNAGETYHLAAQRGTRPFPPDSPSPCPRESARPVSR